MAVLAPDRELSQSDQEVQSCVAALHDTADYVCVTTGALQEGFLKATGLLLALVVQGSPCKLLWN